VIYLQVRFRHKIRKLVDGRSLASARKHTLRLLRTNRFSLDAKRVIETIDRAGFDQIRQRYAVANPGADWPKYLDLERWIGINIRRIRALELDLSRPKRILDLGCGAGYFREITRLLGVHRIVQRIEPFRPLPDLGRKFDLITAFMVCFNEHKMPSLWKVPEWEFFLDDLAKHLTTRGRVWLELNQEYDETFYTPKLKEFFQKRGARINEHKIIFTSGLRAPVSASPDGR
jgi:hypothetical protein